MKITNSKQADQALGKMPANTEARIIAKIVQYAEDPESLANNVTRMQQAKVDDEAPVYRLRVGDWRVIFTLDADTAAEATEMFIDRIAPRGKAYD